MAQSPDKVVATFEVRRRQYLDEKGAALCELPACAGNGDFLRKVYRGMAFARALDAKCVNLQRTGRFGTYATSLGQEAVPIGVASAMRDSDVFVPSYREGSAQIWRGVEVDDILHYFGGSERGQAWTAPSAARDLPICITVGNQALHAAGVAAALKLRGEDAAAVCVFGDGATSKGDVYAAINVAGAWFLPVVFVVCNNQWAISTPRSRQSAAETLAQKGIAGGIAVIQVDGNDVLAVHDVVVDTLERARSGGGATFVECSRLSPQRSQHGRRRIDPLPRPHGGRGHRAACPVLRLRAFIERNGMWSDAKEAAMAAEITAQIDAAIERYLNTPAEQPEAMFDHLYAKLPAAYEAQRAKVAVYGHG